MEQVGDFFADGAVRDASLPVLAHQAMAIRPAFLGLNRVLRDEIAAAPVHCVLVDEAQFLALTFS